jgi:hypothetical protein
MPGTTRRLPDNNPFKESSQTALAEILGTTDIFSGNPET